MDIGDSDGDIGGGFGLPNKPRTLPDDLPKSLDDRKNVRDNYTAETEMYDAWQGMLVSVHQEDFGRSETDICARN